MPRSLILPVDTSEESPKVLQWALRNLLQPGDAVYLVRDGARVRRAPGTLPETRVGADAGRALELHVVHSLEDPTATEVNLGYGTLSLAGAPGGEQRNAALLQQVRTRRRRSTTHAQCRPCRTPSPRALSTQRPARGGASCHP